VRVLPEVGLEHPELSRSAEHGTAFGVVQLHADLPADRLQVGGADLHIHAQMARAQIGVHVATHEDILKIVLGLGVEIHFAVDAAHPPLVLVLDEA
jgi:hypothetical protein